VSARRPAAARRLLAATLALAVAAPAAAQPPHVVALAPLSTLGTETTGAAARKLTAEIERALAEVPGVKVVGARDVSVRIKRAHKSALRACDGGARCLTDLGKLVGADAVVYGEVGGLGDVQVVYLELIDVGHGKEVRSTTLQVGGGDTAGGAPGAAVRLLSPEQFVGRLAVDVDAKGASIYVDGKVVGTSPAGPVDLPVGTHALRVTHPEFRDFVRFVDVPFGKTSEVKVGLQQYPIIERDVESRVGTATRRDYITYAPGGRPRWYRRWYVVAGFGALVLVGAGALAGAAAGGPSADHTSTIDPPPQ
jgi:PEGA domain